MVATDRAFRALCRAEPETLVSLVEVLAPALLPEPKMATLLPHDSVDTWLDRPPHPAEADCVLRIDPGETLMHVEGQGYREDDFPDRVLRYTLTLSLRHWNRTVHTVALWLVRPPKRHRRGVLRHGPIEVKVTTLVLREVDAALLLARPETACFALGADDRGSGHDALCHDAVARLRASGASLRRFQFAAAAARAHCRARFDAMLAAMNAQGVESVIIEDLVKIGEDIGFDKGKKEGKKEGKEEGILQGFRAAVLDLCEVLGLRVDEKRRAALEAMDAKELAALRDRLKTARAW